ncbi:MurR/RpiR family transcriptional regulator [Brevibacillus borstelensis]|uniref:MurR/RpiR family transcriptional regulator n=1 Tax=Brevibacillus borstelensis TaxID=45462 RepID=UPI0030BC041F
MQVDANFDQLLKEKYDELSAAQKKVAKYLLENLEKSAFSTTVQIAREAEVSETTVIRFSYALGFSGFSEMQEMIQQHFLQNASSALSINRADRANSASPKGPFVQALMNEICILQHTLAHLNEAELWKAVDVLIASDHVVIIGHRGSFSAANWISFMLGMIRENVQLCPSNGESYEKLFNLSAKSVVLVISFPRYSKESYTLAETARKLGSTIISVTDSVLSPVGRLSEITLTTDINVDAESGIASMSSVITLLHLLVLGMMVKDQGRLKTRQQRMEQIYHGQGVFIE